MSEGYQLRVKYVKRGRLAFLSHLETIRSMERIIRRAQLPYAITEGFNPHMKVSFGPALPVGAGSYSEYLDLRMREYMKPEEALARMQATSVPDLQPIECHYINLRADAVTVAFPISDWCARFEGADVDELKAAFGALVERGYIEIARKPKKRRGPMEIKQVSFEERLVRTPVCSQDGSDVLVAFTTRTLDAGSLRPDKFIEAAMEFLPGEAPRLASLTRVSLRAED